MTSAHSPALAPFQVRSFRFQWSADLAISLAFEMETLILGWYVLVATGSVQLLVVFGSLQYVGALLSPLFGVAGDRIGHRNLLCTNRAICACLAATMLFLASFDALTPMRVLVIAALSGLLRPSDMMLRNTLIGYTMTAARLLGALGLSRVTGDAARVAGALAGAGMFAAYGIGPAYAAILLLYLTSFGLSLGISGVRTGAAPGVGGAASPWGDLRHVCAYVWRSPELLAALILAFLINVFAYPFVLGLLPYVAREIYGGGQAELGALTASFAAGSLAGSLVISLNRAPLPPARTMLLAAGAWFLLTLAFGFVHSVVAGALILVLIGLSQSLCVLPLVNVMLRSAGPEIRGRVMGMRMLAVLGLQLGLMAAGPLIERAGFTVTATVFAILGAACTLAIVLRWRESVWRDTAPANAR